MASIDDLWLVDFGEPYPAEPGHHRPALILGPPEAFGPTFPYVIVAPLTTVKRGLSLHVEIEAMRDSGLDTTSYVQCELLRSINRKRLVHFLGRIEPESAHRVANTVRQLLRL